MKTYAQIMAIREKQRMQWLKVCPTLHDAPGIYILTREENGFKYCYIGQAKKILSRLVSHLNGYEQYIDNSLRKHKLWSKENPTGWSVDFFICADEYLNEWEQDTIKEYHKKGYQLLNKTTGSQGNEKQALGGTKSRKGYKQGVADGYLKARKEIAGLFEKNLQVIMKGEPNKLKEKAFDKFMTFLRGENEQKD